jgi:hypothetical protein
MFRTTGVALSLALCSCGNGGTGGSVGSVNGTVTFGTNSLPAAGITVLITDAHGVKTSLKTDATGAFGVSGVATPYSAAVIDNPTPIASQTATVYLGLTRTNPALAADNLALPTPNRQGTLAVTLSGGTYPQPAANYTTSFLFQSPRAFQTVSLPGALSATNSLDIGWLDPASSTTSGTLFGLQVQADDTGLPTSYPGYGSTNATLTDAVTTTTALSLASVTSALLTGSVTPPAGYQLVEVDGLLIIPGGFNIQIFADTTQSTTFSYTTPSIPGTTLALAAFASNAAGQAWFPFANGLAAAASGVAFDCPGAPTLTAPPDQQTGVTTATPFSWSSYPGAIYSVSLLVNQGQLTIWTADTSFTLPDLSSVGFGPFPSTMYTWDVFAQAGYSGIDEVTNPSFTPLVGLSCGAVSSSQEFTTSSNP